MNATIAALKALFDRIPRRHSLDNVKEINTIVAEFETQLIKIEAINEFYEKNTATFFDDLENVRSLVKKSTDNKASKKNKDNFFDEASGALKDSFEALLKLCADGSQLNH
ncbi:MAG: hypothetical protein ACKVOW_21315 [Chitinophagaceae bacterium]